MSNDFSNILQEIEERFNKINNLLFVVHKLERRKNQKALHHPNAGFIWETQLDTLKGLIFVQLYGCIEYATSLSISRCDEIITKQHLKLDDYKYSLFSRFLNSKFDALHNVGREKKWLRRFEFISDLSQNIDITEGICVNLELPTDGKNIRYPQLESIWNTFGIRSDVLPSPSLGQRLGDIVDNRNKIAHGNVSPDTIGKSQSYTDMKRRTDEVEEICKHIIESFSKYIQQKDYLK